MEIQDSKPVWVAWTNTDCTEGRGYQIPCVVAESYEAALRLGKGRNVQGSDCSVSKNLAVKINNTWLVPGRIAYENDEDKQKRRMREATLEKAKKAGLTLDDIAALWH